MAIDLRAYWEAINEEYPERAGLDHEETEQYRPPKSLWAKMPETIDSRASMNKGELIDAIAAKAEVTKKDADVILTAALEAIVDAVSSDEKVTLVGFGTFEARDRQAREGRNPATGKPIQIPATKVPAFSAGKLFKEKVSA